MESISTTSAEEKDAAEQKARGLKRIADCLRKAEGIEIKHDIDKLNDLKETRKAKARGSRDDKADRVGGEEEETLAKQGAHIAYE